MKNLKVGPLAFREFQPLNWIILLDYSMLRDWWPQGVGWTPRETTRHNQKTTDPATRYPIDYAQ
jgi:hypothetical protein